MHRNAVAYQIGRSTFRVAYGDITKQTTDAIVSSDDNMLSMGGGVSLAIARAAGDAYYQETRMHAALSVGDVAVSSAGVLPMKHVFHLVTIDFSQGKIAGIEDIVRGVKTVLNECIARNCTSVTFPALATGVARIPFDAVAKAMTEAIAAFLIELEVAITVTLVLHAREMVTQSELDTFYEKAVASAVQSFVAESLQQQLSRLPAGDRAVRADGQGSATTQVKPVISITENTLFTGVASPLKHAAAAAQSFLATERGRHGTAEERMKEIDAAITSAQLLLNQLYIAVQQAVFGEEAALEREIATYQTLLATMQRERQMLEGGTQG